jgi:hypothetical protein
MNKEKNLKMFGVDNIRQWADMAMDASEGDAMGMIRSMLSDVQEMIERDMKEEARLQINRVKYLLKEAEEGFYDD